MVEDRKSLLEGGVPCQHCWERGQETIADVDTGQDFLCNECAKVAKLPEHARRNVPGLARALSWINDNYLAQPLTPDARAVLEDLAKRLQYEHDHGPSTSTFTD